MFRDRYARRRLITFVVLVGLCLVMLAASGSRPVQELRNGIRFAFTPVQDRLAEGTRALTSVLGAFSEVDSLRRANDELTANVAVLQDQLAAMESVKGQYTKLARLLKMQNSLKLDTVAAAVSARQYTQFERLITLDRGTEADIRVGAPVLSDGGALLGRVTEAGEGWADVTLLSDSSFLVAGLDNRTNATGIVVGRLSAPLAMTDIKRSDEISERDLIVTLGADLGQRFRSVYPPGIPIGRVVDIIEEPGQVLKTALIVPQADLEHIEHVLVLTEFTAPRRVGAADQSSSGE